MQATEAPGEDPATRLHGAVRDLGILEGRGCSLLTVTCYGWHLGQGVQPHDVREGVGPFLRTVLRPRGSTFVADSSQKGSEAAAHPPMASLLPRKN